MGQLFRMVKSAGWLLLWGSLAVSAGAQSANYPSADDPWDGTSYRALVQRVENNALPLPTLSNSTTRPVFERMVNADNIPLRMGLNRQLSTTIRFQRLDSALDPIHKLVVLYANEAKKGKPYGAELSALMVYESRVSAALLDLSEPYLATLAGDKGYQVHVAYLDQVKTTARQSYSSLVLGTTETGLYSKPDILKMIGGAIAALPAYHSLLTEQDRHDLTEKLTQHIAKLTDQQLKTALTGLRDMLKHRRIPT